MITWISLLLLNVKPLKTSFATLWFSPIIMTCDWSITSWFDGVWPPAHTPRTESEVPPGEIPLAIVSPKSVPFPNVAKVNQKEPVQIYTNEEGVGQELLTTVKEVLTPEELNNLTINVKRNEGGNKRTNKGLGNMQQEAGESMMMGFRGEMTYNNRSYLDEEELWDQFLQVLQIVQHRN